MFPLNRYLLFICCVSVCLVSNIFGAYTLKPGNVLDINDELTAKQVITPDGTSSVPLLSRIEVQNKNLSELDINLTTEFSKNFKTPQASSFLIPKDTKTAVSLPYFMVLHDLNKDNWEIKSLKPQRRLGLGLMAVVTGIYLRLSE